MDEGKMARTIQFTLKAIKNLQDLQPHVVQQLCEILKRWVTEDHLIHVRPLEHYVNLWRGRTGADGGLQLRVVFRRADPRITVVRVAKRDEVYKHLDRYLIEQPEYTWHIERGYGFFTFINGGYNDSPELTDSQRRTSESIGNHSRDLVAQITQSPPGTGKTIAAASRACDRYRHGWNVIFLIPEKLREQVEKYECIQNLKDQEHEMDPNFFIGTLQEWLKKHQGIPLLSIREEREILNILAEKAKQSGRNVSFIEITGRHVFLFHAYVLNPAEDVSFEKTVVYRENIITIEKLKKIDKDWWHEQVDATGKRDRSMIPELILKIEPSRNESMGTIVIIDEAQDYFLGELRAVRDLCRGWQGGGHLTNLWLLGDLNQRINPVDFDWGALNFKPTELTQPKDPNWRCFRNSGNILRFSNHFLEARKPPDDARKPLAPPDPSRAFEKGEKVKVLTYETESEAEAFLDHLDNITQLEERETGSERSVLYKLGSRIKILHSRSPNSGYSSRLEFDDVQGAKGREFDSCMVFNAFHPSGIKPTDEELQRWYTLLTRPRFRLLIIITEEQRSRLELYIPDLFTGDVHEFLNSSNSGDVDNAIKWIQEIRNDIEISDKQQLRSYLEEGLQADTPVIYWDTYQALHLVGITGDKRTSLERELLKCLRRKYPEEILSAELEEFRRARVEFQDDPKRYDQLECFLLRSLGCYWDAANAVESLRSDDHEEHERRRIVEAIAKDLEELETFKLTPKPFNLVVEAARLRSQKLNISYPDDFPLRDLSEEQGSLIPALVKIMSRQEWYHE